MTKIDNPVHDVRVENHGTIVLLHPCTDAARQWFDEHLTSDEDQFADAPQFYGEAVAAEPRYVANLIDGMETDGLVVV